MFDQLKFDDVPDKAAKIAKDALNLSVGLTVVTVQKAQEQLAELRTQIEARLAASRDQVSTITDRVEPQIKALDERMSALETRISEFVVEYGDRLPEPAEKALDLAFETAKAARAQVRELMLGTSTKAA